MARFQLIPVALVFSLCVLLSVTSAKSPEVQYCNKHSDYPVKVSGVDINPDPVKAGKPATFRISASTDKTISAGKLVIEVYFLGFHVHTETHDICSETKCPISTGDFTISHSQELPGFTPPGNYRLRLKIEGDRNRQLTCIDFNFGISWLADSVAES